jgi:hypothetical protein
LGDRDKPCASICCVYNFQISDFFLFTAMRFVKENKNQYQVAAFCLLVRTSPIDFALFGGTGNRLKLKTTTKLKQTSIAMVRDPLPTFAIFLTPLFLITD